MYDIVGKYGNNFLSLILVLRIKILSEKYPKKMKSLHFKTRWWSSSLRSIILEVLHNSKAIAWGKFGGNQNLILTIIAHSLSFRGLFIFLLFLGPTVPCLWGLILYFTLHLFCLCSHLLKCSNEVFKCYHHCVLTPLWGVWCNFEIQWNYHERGQMWDLWVKLLSTNSVMGNTFFVLKPLKQHLIL